MKKWNLALTYEPKIKSVLSGRCKQTLRIGSKFQVGDLVSFHGWEGKPYRSKWSFRTPYFELIEVLDGQIYPWGLCLESDCEYPWDHPMADEIAKLDGIVPATGIELGNVLNKLNKILDSGAWMQIIRW